MADLAGRAEGRSEKVSIGPSWGPGNSQTYSKKVWMPRRTFISSVTFSGQLQVSPGSPAPGS